MNRNRTRVLVGSLAVATSALVLPLLTGGTPAQALGTQAGVADLAPNTGDSATPFTLNLPIGAACAGDSSNAGWRVTSYMVPESTDPATLQFDLQTGPNPNTLGPGFTQPLYEVGSGSPLVQGQTADATNPGGPGPIVNIPQFDLSSAGFQPGHIPAGVYNVGIACINGPADADQLDRFWNTVMTVTTDAGGGPAQVSFVEGAAPKAPTLDDVTAAPGELTATFTPVGTAVPPATDYTVTATPSGGGTSVTATGAGSPITVSGLMDGTAYDVSVTASNDVGTSPASNVIQATPGDFVAPATPTVGISPDEIDADNQGAVTVSGTGEDGATAAISVDDTDAGTVPVTATVPVEGGAYSATLDLTGLSDGTITATVTLTDAAGNTSNPGTATADKDTAPPPADPVTPVVENLGTALNDLIVAVVEVVNELVAGLGNALAGLNPPAEEPPAASAQSAPAAAPPAAKAKGGKGLLGLF